MRARLPRDTRTPHTRRHAHESHAPRAIESRFAPRAALLSANAAGDGTQRGADGVFHIKHHFTSGTLPHARFHRGVPPGYTGAIPMDVHHNAGGEAYKVGAEPSGLTPRPSVWERLSSSRGAYGHVTPRGGAATPRGAGSFTPRGQTVVRI